MLTEEQYKLFIEKNCLQCEKFKINSDNNCGTYKKIEISQHLEGVVAKAIFPLKNLNPIPGVTKYSCKLFDSKGFTKIKVLIDRSTQLKMF